MSDGKQYLSQRSTSLGVRAHDPRENKRKSNNMFFTRN